MVRNKKMCLREMARKHKFNIMFLEKQQLKRFFAAVQNARNA